MRGPHAASALVLSGALALAACGSVQTGETTPSAWTAWRASRREELAGPDGWLALVGLFWLEPGSHAIGSAQDAELALPSGPAQLGHVVVGAGNDVRFVDDAGHETTLVPDAEPLAIGSLRLLAIVRGGRLALRVRDVASPARERLGALPAYDYDPAYRVRAHVRAPEPGRILSLVNVLGMSVDEPCAALLELTLDGHAITLAATLAGETPDEGYFVMLRDATADTGETYPAGRYLDVAAPDASGQTWVDLNYLYTPPCGYTSLATCPLPPSENVIDTPIRAGERYAPPTSHP